MKHQLAIPVLILHASESSRPIVYSKKVQKSDIVLNIEDINRVGRQIGDHVDLVEIENSIHDVFLSNINSRKDALNKTINWLKTKKEIL